MLHHKVPMFARGGGDLVHLPPFFLRDILDFLAAFKTNLENEYLNLTTEYQRSKKEFGFFFFKKKNRSNCSIWFQQSTFMFNGIY